MKIRRLALSLILLGAVPAQAGPEIIDLSFESFFETAAQSPERMNREYQGRKIRLSGTIYRISEDDQGRPFVEFHSSKNLMQAVRCFFPESAVEELIKLKRDQSLTVVCTFEDAGKYPVAMTGCAIDRDENRPEKTGPADEENAGGEL